MRILEMMRWQPGKTGLKDNMAKEKESFTKDRSDALNIARGDSDSFRKVYSVIVDQARWTTDHEAVVQRVSDGKYFICAFDTPSTEMQDGSEGSGPIQFTEVSPHVKTVVEFV